MDAPDLTYRYIYRRDTAGPTFEVFNRSLSSSAASANTTIDVAGIPKDRVLVLTNAVMRGAPGATQSCKELLVAAISVAGIETWLRYESFADDADENKGLNWKGAAYIQSRGPDENSILLRFVYDAGVNANGQLAFLHGIIIPRGNVAAF